ncbi:MAG TPA: FAD:protein FMN transferase [Gemmatimonadales bacterium]|nr:FAD:protein FMN transferase [Gemmatimonadales bacterium]
MNRNRREFLTLGVGMFVALSLPLALRRRIRLMRRTLPLMGTIAEVQAAHADERQAEAAIDAAFAELEWVERTMSRFRPDSDIGRANRRAALEGVAVGSATALVVATALDWASATEGRFDPAVGAASELWDVLNRHAPPPAAQVASLRARGFWRKVDLSTSGGVPRLRYGDPDLHLDLGAIAKGYAIDRATAALRNQGIRHGIVTVGGDLRTLGGSPEGGPWRVGIRSPHDHAALAATLDIEDRAVATSGDYERFFQWRGVRYHHLIDPVTAAPRRTPLHSMTVVADSAIEADAASTAAFGLRREEAVRLIRRRITGADAIPLA